MSYFVTLQPATIEEKIANAPDDSYQIGLAIGSYLPFVVLIIIAYIMYYRAKNNKPKD